MQQLIEGLIWLTFRLDAPLVNAATTFVYSLFSHVLWPLYVPFAALLLEPVRWRREVRLFSLAAGSAAGLYLLVNMIRIPIVSGVIGGHIEYASPHFYILAVMGSSVASRRACRRKSRSVNLFGLAALLSFIGAYAAYAKWFISVWCFFAAVLSVIVLLHFTHRTSRTKEPAHGMAV